MRLRSSFLGVLCRNLNFRESFNMGTFAEEDGRNLFKGEIDRFRGVSVSSFKEPRTEKEFPQTLQNSIIRWKENKYRAVWMKVNLEHSYWIPTLAANGFEYHHAKPTNVTMVKWLPEDEINRIPSFAHNTLGVGALVVNENEELLVVRERFNLTPHWKLPGGYVEFGENLPFAAIREVKEETGVDTDFESLLAFRHLHEANFGCSDIYFIVILKPKSHAITMCEKELADCQWMKVKTYLEHPDVHETNKIFAKCYLEGKEKGVSIKTRIETLRFGRFSREQVIYHIATDDPALGSSNVLNKTLPIEELDTTSKI